jgi:hypothetical protein
MTEELISRKAALEAVCYNCCDNGNCDGGCADYMEIANIPVIVAKPIIRSKWNYDGSCSNCKAHVLSNYIRFCPACGAEMNGE